MNIYKKISLLFVLALILSGCKNLMPISEKHKEDNNINILNLEFEPEYKYFHANIKLNDSIAALLLLNDTTIKFHVEEYMQNNLLDSRTQPKLINIQKKIYPVIKYLKIMMISLHFLISSIVPPLKV